MRSSVLLVGFAAALFASNLAHGADPRNVDEAKVRFREGRTLVDAGDWEGARVKFAQANALVRSTDTLWSLAAAEVHSSHYVDALNHFYVFLREPKAEPNRIDEARSKWMPLAAQHVAQLQIEAPARAVVELDNRAKLGMAPFADPIAIEPGPHRLIAHIDETIVARDVDVPAGGSTIVNFGDAAPAPPPPEVPPPAALVPAPLPAPTTTTEQTFWTTPHVLGVAFTGATVASLAVAIGFGAAANSNKSHYQELSGASQSASACQGGTPSGYCADLQDAKSSQQSDARVATIGFVGAAAFAVAATTMWLLPSSRGDRPRAKTGLWLTPAIASTSGGLLAGGTF